MVSSLFGPRGPSVRRRRGPFARTQAHNLGPDGNKLHARREQCISVGVRKSGPPKSLTGPAESGPSSKKKSGPTETAGAKVGPAEIRAAKVGPAVDEARGGRALLGALLEPPRLPRRFALRPPPPPAEPDERADPPAHDGEHFERALEDVGEEGEHEEARAEALRSVAERASGW